MQRLWRITLPIALAAGLLFGLGAHAQEDDLVEVDAGMQAVGTFSWIVHAMNEFGFDEDHGIDVVGTTYASKQATALALREGEADVTVDDFLGGVILRENGVEVTAIYPYAKAIGAIVVPTDSEVESIEDLRGATIAAASVRDKSLLILRSLTIEEYGFDVQEEGEVVEAAPPLMMELIANGEVDAGLPYWHFVARLEGAGDGHELVTVADLMERLGLPSDLPNLVLLARDDMPAEDKTAFIAAFQDTIEHLQTLPPEDPFWQSLLDQELYSLPDESLFPAVVERWKTGTPDVWTEETADALVEIGRSLLEFAGPDVLGVEAIPRDAYTTEFNP